jgi:hypothetical protein
LRQNWLCLIANAALGRDATGSLREPASRLTAGSTTVRWTELLNTFRTVA